MEKKEVLNTLKTFSNGEHIIVGKIKEFPNNVKKLTFIDGLIGVKYTDLENVKKRLELNNKESQGLPWGKWLTDFDNMVIEHKGSYYLRISNNENTYSKSIYLHNGKEISKETAIKIVDNIKLLNDKESKSLDVFNIKFENISFIRKK